MSALLRSFAFLLVLSVLAACSGGAAPGTGGDASSKVDSARGDALDGAVDAEDSDASADGAAQDSTDAPQDAAEDSAADSASDASGDAADTAVADTTAEDSVTDSASEDRGPVDSTPDSAAGDTGAADSAPADLGSPTDTAPDAPTMDSAPEDSAPADTTPAPDTAPVDTSPLADTTPARDTAPAPDTTPVMDTMSVMDVPDTTPPDTAPPMDSGAMDVEVTDTRPGATERPTAVLSVTGRPRRGDAFATVVRLDASGSTGGALSYQWFVGEARVLSGSLTAPSLTVSVGGSADLPVMVDVTNTLGSARATGTIQLDDPPVANAGSSRVVAVGAAATLDGAGSSDREGDPIAWRWTVDAAPAGSAATLAGASSATPSLVPDLPGSYRLALVVSGSGGESAPAYTSVTATAPSSDPPTLTLTATGTVVMVGTPVTFGLVSSTAPGVTITGRTLTVNGMSVPVDGAGRATFTPGAPGAYDVVAVVTASNGTSSEFRATLYAAGTPDSGSRPTLDLRAPPDGTILTAATDVTGSAGGTDFARYVVEVAPAGSSTFTTVATGAAPVTLGRLAVLDPARYIAGTYTLRVTAYDTHGHGTRTESAFVVDSDRAAGNYRLSFRDLELNLVGVPIVLDRRYDSMDARSLDFGVGWELSVGARPELTFPPGRQWTFDFSRCVLFGRDATPVREHILTIRLLGRRYSFRFLPFRERCGVGTVVLRPRWSPMPGTVGTLTPDNEPNFLQLQGAFDYLDVMDRDGLGPTGEIYDPQDFTLTLPEGHVIRFNRTRGITSATDPRRNGITVTPTAVRHSSGVTVAIARDPSGRVTRVTRPDGANRTYTYNSVGDLVAATDFRGNTTRFVYARNHRLAQVIDPSGSPGITSEYDPEGRLTATVDPLGRRTTMAYDDAARTLTATDRLGRRTVTTYDARGLETATTLPDGSALRYEYTTGAQRSAVTDRLGRRTTYSYTTAGFLSAMTLPTGLTRAATYDSAGRALTSTDGLGHTSTFTYDAGGLLTRWVDAAGNAEGYTYNTQGALSGVALAGGASFSLERDARGFATALTGNGARHTMELSPLGEVLTDRWTADGRDHAVRYEPGPEEASPAAIVSPEGWRSTASYDFLGRRTESVRPGGERERTEYDLLGRVTASVRADGTATRYEYDAEGQVTAVVSASGARTAFTRDALGRVTAIALPGGGSARRAYGLAGVTSSVDPAGRETRYDYDTLGRQTQVTSPGGLVTRYTYGRDGRLAATTAPDGVTTTLERDPIGRTSAITRPLPGGASATTRVTFLGASGRLTSVRDPNGNETRFTYASGLLTAWSDPLGNTVRYERSGGSVSAVTDPLGRRTTLDRDAAGNILAETRPDGRRSTVAYDTPRRTNTRTLFDGSTTVTGVMDARGRPISVTASDGTSLGYTYHPSGRRASTRDARGATSVLYTAGAMPAAFVEPDGRAVRYQYAVDGALAEVATPNGTTRYEYDSAGRLLRVADLSAGVTTYTRDAVGRPLTVTTPDGYREVYSYEPSTGRLASVAVLDAASAPVFREDYTYDPGDRVLSVRDLAGVTDYTYDAANRLLSETRTPTGGSARRTDYTYDAAGNLTRIAGPSGARTLTYDTLNRLTSDGEASYRYDPEGNLVEVTGGPRAARSTWDALGRLTGADTTGPALGAHSVRYAYDADGLLVERTVDGVVRRYLWDRRGVPEVLEETDAAGRLVARNIPEARLVGRSAGGTTRYLHRDRLGSVRVVTSTAGAPTLYRFNAWGEAEGPGPDEASPYGFAGERLDPSTGLYDLRARRYAPHLGRFISMDPVSVGVGEGRMLNGYVYAEDSPTLRVDPTGEFALDVSFGAVISGILNSTASLTAFRYVQLALNVAALGRGVVAFIDAIFNNGVFSTPHAFSLEGVVLGASFARPSLSLTFFRQYTAGTDNVSVGELGDILLNAVFAPFSNFSLLNFNAGYDYDGEAFGPIGLFSAGGYAGAVFDCPTPGSYAGPFDGLAVSFGKSFGSVGGRLDAIPIRAFGGISLIYSLVQASLESPSFAVQFSVSPGTYTLPSGQTRSAATKTLTATSPLTSIGAAIKFVSGLAVSFTFLHTTAEQVSCSSQNGFCGL
ncbi:MAG: hypothetical protein HY909_20500 [Deltaproteobacteria bacterium]|nr:hypothetical protein [Deltaproteobacteria bacterium]